MRWSLISFFSAKSLITSIVWLVTSDFSMPNSNNSSLGACFQRNRINRSSSLSTTSACSSLPFQEKVNMPLESSTLSANHSCKPEEVERNSYRIVGEQRTGYSKVYSCFLVIIKNVQAYKGCNNRKLIVLAK